MHYICLLLSEIQSGHFEAAGYLLEALVCKLKTWNLFSDSDKLGQLSANAQPDQAAQFYYFIY